jgi:hypothetical protein
MKKSIILLFSILSLSVVSAQPQPPIKARIAGLENNAEYMELLADGVRLQQQEDSVMRVIEQNRRLFSEDPANRSKYGDAILALEEQVFGLRNRKGDIFGRINTIEQDWLIENMNSGQPSQIDGETVVADTIIEPATVQTTRIVDDIHFVNGLDSVDYVALQRAQNDELKVVEFVNMFSENHAAMGGMEQAAVFLRYLLRLVQAHEQQPQEGRVVLQSQPA